MMITGKSIDTFVGYIVGTFDDYAGAMDVEERDLHFIRLTAFYMAGCAFGVLREVSVFVDVMDAIAQSRDKRHEVFHSRVVECLTDEARALYDEVEEERRQRRLENEA